MKILYHQGGRELVFLMKLFQRREFNFTISAPLSSSCRTRCPNWKLSRVALDDQRQQTRKKRWRFQHNFDWKEKFLFTSSFPHRSFFHPLIYNPILFCNFRFLFCYSEVVVEFYVQLNLCQNLLLIVVFMTCSYFSHCTIETNNFVNFL